MIFAATRSPRPGSLASPTARPAVRSAPRHGWPRGTWRPPPSHSRPRQSRAPRNCATGSARRSGSCRWSSALAVELCYELGYSCEEIAAIMNCPVNTVKTRLFHARAQTAEAAAAAGRCRPPRPQQWRRATVTHYDAQHYIRARRILAAAAVARQRAPGRRAAGAGRGAPARTAPPVPRKPSCSATCARRSPSRSA